MFARREDCQLAERRSGTIGDACEQRSQMVPDPAGHLVREASPVGGKLDRQGWTIVARHDDRIVCRPAEPVIADGPVTSPLVQRITEPVVFEDDDALEERLAGRQLAPALHCRQGSMLVCAHGEPSGPNIPQPFGHRF